MSLLTSQSVNHGLSASLGNNNEPGCQKHIQDYFQNGYVMFVDGTVCGAPFASESCLEHAFDGGGCEER